MDELKFSFTEMLREIQDFTLIAREFLHPTSEQCLENFSRALQQIRDSAPVGGRDGQQAHIWAIMDDEPLLTRPSKSYERGEREGGPEMCARVTAIWEIRPNARPKKSMQSKAFSVTGIASVRVEWYETFDGELYDPLGMWRMEIADGVSPGCYFHVQIQGEANRTAAPFPHAVPVPRLPCIAFTPMSVLEFVLGELFQDEWEYHCRSLNASVEAWRGIQRNRLNRLFQWQQTVILDNAAPPWTILKSARPESKLFIEP